MVEIGQKVKRYSETFFDPEREKGTPRHCERWGTVVYIHSKKRFHIVRFDFLYGSFCETFAGVGD